MPEGEYIYLISPHAKMIWQSNKDLIIKSKKFINSQGKTYYLVESNQCFGIITINKIREIDLKDFKQLEKKHRISEHERKEWWPDKKILYAYEFSFKKFERPRDVLVPKGIQTFGKNLKFLTKEMKESITLIKDISKYNPEGLNNKQLADDWRIACAWHSAWKRTRGTGIKFTKNEIIETGKRVYKEIKKRIHAGKMEHTFKPEEMKPPAKELYNLILESLTETGYGKPAPSGKDMGEVIYLDDIFPRFKSFKDRKPFVSIVGGLAVWRKTKGDIDILIRKKKPEDEREDIPLKFRIMRMLPKELWPRIQWLYDDEYLGPFTDYIPLYDRLYEKQDFQVIEMSEEDKLESIIKNLGKISNEELKKRHGWLHSIYDVKVYPKDDIVDAHIKIWGEMQDRNLPHPMKDDLDKKSRFTIQEYPPPPEMFAEIKVPIFLKPRQGYEKFEFADPHTLWKNWKLKYAPQHSIYIEPKWDGFAFGLSKDGNKIKLITEDRRRDRAHILPQVVASAKKLDANQCILFGEMLWFENTRAKEREEGMAIIAGKSPIPGDVRLYVFDITYYNGKSLVELPFSERLKYLKRVLPKDLKNVKTTPMKLVSESKEFLNTYKKFSEVEGSEGIMCKREDFKYELDGRTFLMSKVKKSYDIEVEVEKRNPKIATETKKPIPGQYLYDVIVRDLKGKPIPIGRTFSTAIKANPGEILTVRTARIRGFYTPDKKAIARFSMMWPKVLKKRTDVKKPISYKEIMKIAWVPEELQQAEVKIKFLGTRGEVEEHNPRHFFHSGVLLTYKNRKLLLDCGENLVNKFRKADPDAIAITHSHSDHLHGLAQGFSRPVFMTAHTARKAENYPLEDLRIINEGKTFGWEDFEITPFRMVHSIKAPAVALKIKVGNKVILYAPDMISIPNKVAYKDVDVYIGDGSSPVKDLIRRKGEQIFGHSSMITQIKACEKQGINHIIFTHFGKQLIEDEESMKKRILTEVPAGMVIEFANDDSVFSLEEIENIEFEKKLGFIWQYHFRGKSCHGDLRFERNDHLEGWTLDDLIKKEIPEAVTTIEQAKKEVADPTNWKIDWNTGKTKMLPTGKPQKILTQEKARQPKHWLTFRGVIPPGRVGATRFYPGVIVEKDRGWYETGTRKPYMYEYFLHGGKLKGRYIFRKLPTAGFRPRPGKEPFKLQMVWFFWRPDEQLPYILTRRAVKTGTLPPVRESWIPKEIEQKIPENLQYWKPGKSSDRFNKLKEAVELFKKKKLEENYLKEKIEFLKEMDNA